MLVALSGCSSTQIKPLCEIEQAVSHTVSDFAVKSLDCEDTACVYDKTYAIAQTLHACTVQSRTALFERGFVGDAICGPLSNRLVDEFATKIPLLTECKCKATNAKDVFKLGAVTACKAYFPF